MSLRSHIINFHKPNPRGAVVTGYDRCVITRWQGRVNPAFEPVRQGKTTLQEINRVTFVS